MSVYWAHVLNPLKLKQNVWYLQNLFWIWVGGLWWWFSATFRQRVLTPNAKLFTIFQSFEKMLHLLYIALMICCIAYTVCCVMICCFDDRLQFMICCFAYTVQYVALMICCFDDMLHWWYVSFMICCIAYTVWCVNDMLLWSFFSIRYIPFFSVL